MGDFLFDIIIVAVLVLFAWRGAAKGLILSLCGLAAVFVAFFAAQFISEQFCAPVSNIFRPIIIQAVRGRTLSRKSIRRTPRPPTPWTSCWPPSRRRACLRASANF